MRAEDNTQCTCQQQAQTSAYKGATDSPYQSTDELTVTHEPMI